MFAGYFRTKEKILSFEEILEITKKEDASKYLVIFNKTLDYYGNIWTDSLHFLSESQITQVKKVNYQERMKRIDTRKNLLAVAASEYGPYNYCNCCRPPNVK